MKRTKTTTTTTTTKRATTVRKGKPTVTVALCSKCGRDNRRSDGLSGDCRNTAACKARQAIVAEAIAAGASL